MEIVPLERAHWVAVAAIYEEGIATRMATFETDTPDWDFWDSNHLQQCRLAAIRSSEMIGWAALLPVSNRKVYAGVAEVSIYVKGDCQGQGIGKQLLNALISQSEDHGIWTLQSALFAENEASVKLHLACGFREIGYKEKIAKLDGVWRDTVLMERRSKAIY